MINDVCSAKETRAFTSNAAPTPDRLTSKTGHNIYILCLADLTHHVSDLHRPTRVYSTAVTHRGTRAICTQCPDIEVSTQVSPSTAASTHPIVAIKIQSARNKWKLDCGTTCTRGQIFWCGEQEIKQALFCSRFQVWIICTILQFHDTRARAHTHTHTHTRGLR